MIRHVSGPGHALVRPVRVAGRGLHTGAPAEVELLPAERPGWCLVDDADRWHPIAEAALRSTDHRTELVAGGTTFATLEHLLAALSGLALGGVGIRLRGGEVPALDGSALPWVEAVRPALRPATVRWAVVDDAVSVLDGASEVRVLPAAGRALEVAIAFPALPEGVVQHAAWDGVSEFGATVAGARTFAFASWLDSLRAAGLARGGDLSNAVLFSDGPDGSAVVNPEGLRMADEPARHKLLDLIGDLGRIGAPLRARIIARRPGHGINARLVARLLDAR